MNEYPASRSNSCRRGEALARTKRGGGLEFTAGFNDTLAPLVPRMVAWPCGQMSKHSDPAASRRCCVRNPPRGRLASGPNRSLAQVRLRLGVGGVGGVLGRRLFGHLFLSGGFLGSRFLRSRIFRGRFFDRGLFS